MESITDHEDKRRLDCYNACITAGSILSAPSEEFAEAVLVEALQGLVVQLDEER
jgi:hypothetical protein